jgi:anaerobic selenocysteine-containing dehydrogenase
VFRLLAARMGFSDVLPGQRRRTGRHGLQLSGCARHPFRLGCAQAEGLAETEYAGRAIRPGGFPTPSGKCEFYSASMAADGLDPLPAYIAPYESVASNPELAKRYPLAMISPPARNFLNSTFQRQEPAFGRRRAASGHPSRR